MSEEIKFTASLTDAPFAAGVARMKALLGTVGESFGKTEAIAKVSAVSMSDQVKMVSDSIRSEMSGIGGHFSGLFEALGNTRTGFIALGAAMAFVGAKKAADATAAITEAAMDLGRVLGSSTNTAQAYILALEDIGSSQEEFQGAAKGMARQLKENEKTMQDMGLQTRDAAGHLRPLNELMIDGIGLVNQYAAGADQALAAQQLFGRGVDASSKLLLLNTDAVDGARETMAELGLEVGANAVTAWRAYDAATDRAGFAMKGLGNTIGTAVMPMVTDLINLFNAAMPGAIVVVRGALSGLTTAFLGVRNGIVAVWETADAFVFTIAEPFRALSEAVWKAANGDFKGADDAISKFTGNISERWSRAMATIGESSRRTKEQIAALWSTDVQPGTPEGAGQGTRTVAQKAEKAKREKPAPSEMPGFEAELEAQRVAYYQEKGLRDMSKAEELAYWEEIAKRAELSMNDRVAVRRKVSQLELQVLREMASQGRLLDEQERQFKQQDALFAVQLAEQEARGQFELGQISKLQLLEQERQFEEQRNEIRRQYLLARLQEVDPERDPVLYRQRLAEIEQLEREHRLRLGQMSQEVQKQNPIASMWKDSEAALASSAQAMLNKTATLRQGLASAWQGIRNSITGEITKIIAAKVIAFARERLFAVAEVGMNAAKAGSGAAASVAGIPIVGPALAMAALASVFAGVSGMSGKIPSAAGGWSIPRGVNPVTQLHEEEMVLQADLANPLRDALTGGGSLGGHQLTYIDNSGRLTPTDIRRNARVLAEELERLTRNGWRTKE